MTSPKTTLIIQGKEFETSTQKPSCVIEEEINFLGDKCWIPGKCTWDNMTLYFKGKDAEEVANLISVYEEIVLRTKYSNPKFANITEFWTFKNCTVEEFSDVLTDDNRTNCYEDKNWMSKLTIKIKDVGYRSTNSDNL